MPTDAIWTDTTQAMKFTYPLIAATLAVITVTAAGPALANGTVRAFKTLGVWAGMEREAAPIRKIHISDQGRFGAARIDAAVGCSAGCKAFILP